MTINEPEIKSLQEAADMYAALDKMPKPKLGYMGSGWALQYTRNWLTARGFDSSQARSILEHYAEGRKLNDILRELDDGKLLPPTIGGLPESSRRSGGVGV